MFVFFLHFGKSLFYNNKCLLHAIVYSTYDNHRAGMALVRATFFVFSISIVWFCECLFFKFMPLLQSSVIRFLQGSFTYRAWATWTKVPRLPIRDCTGSSNNLVPRSTNVSAIDVTAKAFFERLYVVPGLRQFAAFVTMPSAPTPPPFTLQLFLDLSTIFFLGGRSFFSQHDSPSNLA